MAGMGNSERFAAHRSKTVQSTAHSNAHAERFVRSVKEECLNRVIPLGEWHFRRTLAEFVVHYHRERNHQGLGNELIDGNGVQPRRGRVRRRQRIGGFLSYYYRAA
jgi:putative transposase